MHRGVNRATSRGLNRTETALRTVLPVRPRTVGRQGDCVVILSGASDEPNNVVRLGDICELYTGRAPRGVQCTGSGEVRLVRGYDLRDGSTLSHERLQQISSSTGLCRESRLRLGDILIPSVTRKPRAVLVNREMGECYAHHTVTVVRPKIGAPPPSILAEYLRSPAFMEFAESYAARLNENLRLSPYVLSNLPIPAQLASAEPIDSLGRFFLSGLELRAAIADVRRLTPELILHLKKHERDLESVPWQVFEELVAEFMASWGFTDVRLVGRDPSTQADIMAVHWVEPSGVRLKYFVEVKHTKDSVGMEVISQVYGAFALEQPIHGWTLAMIVSLGGFKDTKRLGRSDLELRNLHLKGRKDVLRWLGSYQLAPGGLWLRRFQES